MFPENLELRSAVFRRMGFVLLNRLARDYEYEADYVWKHDSWPDDKYLKYLPPIESQWEVTAKYLVPFMRERNYNYSLSGIQNKLGMVFIWYGGHMSMDRTAEIKSDNIAEAACQAFMEVEI